RSVTAILGFFFSSRRRHTRFSRDWSSDVCSSDLRTFDVLGHLERDSLTLDQGPVTLGVDRGEVHEHVSLTVLPLDEPVTLLRVKPFDRPVLQERTPFDFSGSLPDAPSIALLFGRVHKNLAIAQNLSRLSAGGRRTARRCRF